MSDSDIAETAENTVNFTVKTKVGGSWGVTIYIYIVYRVCGYGVINMDIDTWQTAKSPGPAQERDDRGADALLVAAEVELQSSDRKTPQVGAKARAMFSLSGIQSRFDGSRAECDQRGRLREGRRSSVGTWGSAAEL